MDRKIEKKTWPISRIITLLGVLLACVLILYYGVFRSSDTTLQVDVSRVTIVRAEVAPFQEFITVNATVVPLRSIFLDAVEGGRVEQILAESGSFLEAGDTILILSNSNLRLDVMNRETQILEQMNNMRNTRLALQQQRISLRSELLTNETELLQRVREFQRDSTLFVREGISRHQYEESRQRYQEVLRRRDLYAEQVAIDSLATESELMFIRTALENMQRNLGLVRSMLDNLVIRAPISGQITSLDAEIGETKQSGQRLGQVDRVDGYRVRALIDENFIVRVSAGQRAEFDFGGQTYQMNISRVFPEVADGRFQADLDFTGPQPESIRRGQSLRLRLSLSDESEALIIDRGGFFQQTGGNWIYVVDASGKEARKRTIRLGRQNTQSFVIESGLEPGEQVIISSYDGFGNSDRLILN